MTFSSVADLCPNPQLLAPRLNGANVQGWHSDDPLFAKLIEEVRPETIIEVGTWKGASALHMAGCRHALGKEGWRIFCVDTFLGGPDHYAHQETPANDLLRDPFGYPQIYHQFLYNVATSLFASRIFPVVQPSTSGGIILGRAGIRAELIYIDGSHEYEDVFHDLSTFCGLLAPNGIIFGDDWTDFTGVRLAVTRFAYENGLRVQLENGFWVIRT